MIQIRLTSDPVTYAKNMKAMNLKLVRKKKILILTPADGEMLVINLPSRVKSEINAWNGVGPF